MPRTPRWTQSPLEDGVVDIHLTRWGYFDDFIRQEMLDYRSYIWRGQASAEWSLEPTLDRLLRKQGMSTSTTARDEHLRRFKFSSRGRRGSNPPNLQNDNDWWALGQHFGLATPLLDWTASPYVASYFAYVQEDNDAASRRAIWALGRQSVDAKCEEIREKWNEEGSPPVIELQNFKGDREYWRLIRITVPNSDRAIALRLLNRMNINHLSPFPDLYGASKFANLDLLIDKY